MCLLTFSLPTLPALPCLQKTRTLGHTVVLLAQTAVAQGLDGEPAAASNDVTHFGTLCLPLLPDAPADLTAQIVLDVLTAAPQDNHTNLQPWLVAGAGSLQSG